MSLGQDVRTRRRSLGLGQIELAELADVSERFVRSVEQDKATVRLDKLTAVLDVLGLNCVLNPVGASAHESACGNWLHWGRRTSLQEVIRLRNS